MEKNRDLTYIGIDYSMSSPAICVYTGKSSEFVWRECQFYIRDSKGKSKKTHEKIIYDKENDYSDNISRYDAKGEWELKIIEEYDPTKTYIIIEDYAFGAKGRLASIGENTGILKHKLWLHGYNLGVCSPSKVKKFATGNGNANKNIMFDAWITETGLNLLPYFFTPKKTKVDSPVADIVDAYYLCKILSSEAE